VLNTRVTEKNGEVVGFRQVADEEEILMITDRGRLIRTPVSPIRQIGRVTQGVKLMDLDEGEQVVDVAVLQESEEPKEEGEN
jgi:DNA gyrase subunit A